MILGKLEYTVSMKRASSHYFDVTLRVGLPVASRGPMRLMMPAWTPGHYAIDDFARNVPDLRARAKGSGEGWRQAGVEKESKNVWKVAWHGSTDAVEVEYQVYAFEYHDTKSYLDQAHAIINGASVFVYPVGMEGSPVTVRVLPYKGWRKAATGLEKVSGWEFSAPNVDVLIDSPVEVGNQEVRSFTVRNVEHQVSMFGEAPVDRKKFVGDIKKIVEEEVAIFGHIPYRRYVFIVDFTDDVGGGLEHLNSTVCFVPRLRLVPKEEYDLTMGLFSHEFFHAWNVKRLRPMELGPFDYTTENYTKALWVAEGITSYYDDHVLRRAGIYSVPEYLDAFTININLMKSMPGSRVQSAQESSFDTWIKFYRSDANSPNVTMSDYTQGAVIGWMLDMQIRKNTRGERSLDDVMRGVYEETYSKDGRGYTDDEFEAATVRLGGEDGLKEIFGSRVKGREEVDFDKYLGYAGLRLEPKEGPERVRGFLGIRIGGEAGKAVVRTRLAGSPAEAIGLSTGDEIIGVDGLRLSPDRLSFYVANKKPGAWVKILSARNGTIRELSGELGRRPPFEYRIAPVKGAGEAQRSLFRNWLLEEWKPEIKYPEYAKSPDRKQTLDFV